jgi:exoribonuclease-2
MSMAPWISRRWDRIVEIAAKLNWKLPWEPDSSALASFLAARKAADPIRFPDLSLSVIKLLGPGEFVSNPRKRRLPATSALPSGITRTQLPPTAPNRRFADLITHRVLKAALDGEPMPYSLDELVELARHCTQKENDANKVERLVAKSAAAMLLSSRIGDQFDAMCTGAADKGTWVRIFHPPVEGRLLYGHEGVVVGNRLRVQLVHTDVERGFVDFKQIHKGKLS